MLHYYYFFSISFQKERCLSKLKRILILILCIVLMVSSAGCWDQKIYENSGFVLQVGFDSNGPDKILMSFLTPVVDPIAKEPSELIYAKENLVRKFREDARKTSDKLIEGAKIQQVLISDSLAKEGINNLLEVIEREPTDPPITYIVVVEGNVLEMEKAAKQFADKPPRPAFYINDLIKNNIKFSYIPESRVFQFSTKYFSPGIDPIVPMMKLQADKGRGIEVTGTALFSGDKMVGKIDTIQTPMLLAMMGNMKSTTFISKKIAETNSENKKSGCAVTFNKAKRKLSVKIINNTPVVDISLAFSGSIGEFQWNHNYDEELQSSLEKKLSSEIKQICEDILKYTQEVGSDPIGIGDIVRANYDSYWQKVKWEDTYKDVIFNVKVNVNILNHGAIR
jgi:spore germination protein